MNTNTSIMTAEYYFADSRMSRGDYLNFKRSSKEGRFKRTEAFKKTTAMNLGSAFHYLMEVDGDIIKFKERVVVFDDELRPAPDKDYRTKLNKEWKNAFYENAEGKTVISIDEFVTISGMRESILSTDFYKRLAVNEQRNEVVYTTKTEKCLCDRVVEYDKSIVVIDWKTTSEVLSTSELKMTWAIKKWDLQVQQAHYTNVVEEATGKSLTFMFVFVETKAPYEAMPVIISKDSALAKEGQRMLAKCKENYRKFLDNDLSGISSDLNHGILTIK